MIYTRILQPGLFDKRNRNGMGLRVWERDREAWSSRAVVAAAVLLYLGKL